MRSSTATTRYVVRVEQAREDGAITLSEQSTFGSTALSFSPMEARAIGEYLLRAADRLTGNDAEEEDEGVESFYAEAL